MEYEQREESVTVPKNTGVEGFLRTLRGILILPRVQSIKIDAKGKVSYTRYVHADEVEGPLQTDYTGLDPWSIIRHGAVEEVPVIRKVPAPVLIAYLLDQVAREGLVPVAFATGAASEFWDWHARTAGLQLVRQGTAYGIPIYLDRQIPDAQLILCAGYTRGGLVDCHRFFSVSMQETVALSPARTNVRVLK